MDNVEGALASRSRVRRGLGLFAVFVVTSSVLGAVAFGQAAQEAPDSFEAATAAAGVSIISFKQPNPLPVGPGAFFTAEMPEVAGGMTPGTSIARTSVFYPGPLLVGTPALLCTAGATPFCGQNPLGPIVAEAQHPSKPSAEVATNSMAIGEPSSPVQTGAGSGRADVTAQTSTSTSKVSGFTIGAPDAAREAILEALSATLDALPVGGPQQPDTSLMRVGGGTSTQTIQPIGDGLLRAEAKSVISDISMLAGAVTIDSVEVHAFAISDGDRVRDAKATTKASGVLVGGFPATIGPDGISIDGNGDGGQARQQLNGVAAQVNDAVMLASDKLAIEIRDGKASATPDGSSAAADGMRIGFSNQPLTETSPPQVPQLCAVTDVITGPLAGGGLILPPICAVPDATGTSDSYSISLGKAAVFMSAQVFPDFFDSPVDADTGLASPFADLDPGGPAITGGRGAGGSDLPIGDVTSDGVPDPRVDTSQIDVRSPSFLALEDRWLGGQLAVDRFPDFYFALVVLGTALTLVSRFVFRATRVDLTELAVDSPPEDSP